MEQGSEHADDGNSQTEQKVSGNNFLLPTIPKSRSSLPLSNLGIDSYAREESRSFSVGGQNTGETSSQWSGRKKRKFSRLDSRSIKTGESILVEIDEELSCEPGERFKVARKNSLNNASTIGGIAIIHDSEDETIDKKIRKKIAHHSPTAALESKKEIDEDDSKSQEIRERRLDQGGVLRRIFQHFSHHLYIALATPSIVRVPHLAHKYAAKTGSGFVFAYTLSVLFIAVPICILEMAMGQYSSLGPINIFGRCLPVLKGVGYGMTVTCALLMLMTSTWLSWSTFYLFQSMASPLPWAQCPTNVTMGCMNPPDDEYEPGTNMLASKVPYLASDYFFQMNVTKTLYLESNDPLEFNLTMMGILLAVWMILLFLMSQHESWHDRWFSWIMSLLTLCLVIILMTSGVYLESSGSGLKTAFQLNFTNIQYELKDPTLWLDSFGQAFWSLGPAIGILIARSSYNNFEHKIYQDVTISVLMNFVFQILMMLMIFSYFGHLKNPTIFKNLGFFFVMSSYAVSDSSGSHILSVLFYFCVCKCLLSHTIILADTVSVSLTDSFPVQWRGGSRRFLVDTCICIFGFLASLIFVTKEGIYYMTTLDALLPWISGCSFAILEVAALAYVYKTSKIDGHFHKMQNIKTSFKYIWKYFTPFVLMAFLIWASINGIQNPISWDHLVTTREDTYFPFGIIVSLIPLVIAVSILLIQIVKNIKNLKDLIKPSADWGSAIQRHQVMYENNFKGRRRSKPWIVIYAQEGELIPSDISTYIPYGHFWTPKTSSDYLLKETNPDINPAVRRTLGNLLKKNFSNQRRIGSFFERASGTVTSTMFSDEENYLRDRNMSQVLEWKRQNTAIQPEIEVTQHPANDPTTSSVVEQTETEDSSTNYKKIN